MKNKSIILSMILIFALAGNVFATNNEAVVLDQAQTVHQNESVYKLNSDANIRNLQGDLIEVKPLGTEIVGYEDGDYIRFEENGQIKLAHKSMTTFLRATPVETVLEEIIEEEPVIETENEENNDKETEVLDENSGEKDPLGYNRQKNEILENTNENSTTFGSVPNRQFMKIISREGTLYYLLVEYDDVGEEVKLLTEVSDVDLLDMANDEAKIAIQEQIDNQKIEETLSENEEVNQNINVNDQESGTFSPLQIMLVLVLVFALLTVGYLFIKNKNKNKIYGDES